MDERNYPINQLEFDMMFADEDACWRYLAAVRWPQGFRCPACVGTKSWLNGRRLQECSTCGHQVSPTAGTILHKTRKPLKAWFTAMWWVCTQKTGGSAKGLQRLMGFESYQTAWTWLHKLRRAMVRANREKLTGSVEVDDAFIGGDEAGAGGRGTSKKAKIVIGIEIPDDTRKARGRVRLQVIKDFSGGSLTPFLVDNIEPGSIVVTDGWQGYSNVDGLGFKHRVHVGNPDLLPNVHLVIALLKRWLLGTHQGAVRHSQLQHYLDEFAFRFNRRKSGSVGLLFYRLVQGVCAMQPTPYGHLKAAYGRQRQRLHATRSANMI